MTKTTEMKVKKWYELGSSIYRLNIVYSKSKDEFDFIRDIREHFIKSRVDKNYFMFDDRKILIKDMEIRAKVIIQNNKSIFTTPDKLLVMIGIIATALVNMFKDNYLIGYIAFSYAILLPIIVTSIILWSQEKNLHKTSFVEICLDIITNIDSDLYENIIQVNIEDEVEPKSIIENKAIIKKVSEVE